MLSAEAWRLIAGAAGGLILLYAVLPRGKPTVLVFKSRRRKKPREAKSIPLDGLPPPFPNGWYALLRSEQLPPGAVKHVAALGTNFAVWRDSAGAAFATHAFCPHLGANMGAGGAVRDGLLVCPFHGWRFDGSGQCRHIPVPGSDESARIPSVARAQAFPCAEAHGLLFVYYHAALVQDPKRAVPAEPAWLLDAAALGATAGLVLHARSVHVVRAHIADIPENGADRSHFDALHTDGCLPWRLPGPLSRLARRHVRHHWEWTWSRCSDPAALHTANVAMSSHVTICGAGAGGALGIEGAVRQIGPGLTVICFRVKLLPTWRFVVIETVLPREPMKQVVQHFLWASAATPRWLAITVFRVLLGQFERDVDIWDQKQYLSAPAVVKGDGPILDFRRWWKAQHTGPESVPFRDAVARLQSSRALDW